MIDIFITDLIAYNEGHLVGRWLTLPLPHLKLVEAIYEVLREGEEVSESNAHEEVFITDYEAVISIDEYDDIARLNELAEKLNEYSDHDLLKLKLLQHEGYNAREVIDKGINAYEVEIHDFRGNNSFTDTFELLAEELVEEGLFGAIPKSLEFYIDYSAIARDLRMDYCEFVPNVIGRIA